VYIGLNEELDPVNRQYFTGKTCIGYRCFLDYDFEVIDSCYKACKANFVSLLNPPNNKYFWLEEPAEDEMPTWIKER